MTQNLDALTPDCKQCAALCCVAFAFDRSDEFGHNKSADEACKHLDDRYRCHIHENLGARGYGGCRRFDCLGAGPRVTQVVFGGGDWQKNPALLAPMSAAFRAMRRIHHLLRLLDSAHTLALAVAAETERLRLVAGLDPDGGWTTQSLAAFECDRRSVEIWAFIRSLAGKMAPDG